MSSDRNVSYEEKCRRLHGLMSKYTSRDVAVAFSGGADSALLLKMAVVHGTENGSSVVAITADTKLHPAGDEAVARRVAEETGAEHRVLKICELDLAQIAENPVDRCYHCKKFLFEAIRKEAEKVKAAEVLEGTNTDDLKQYRPGLRAVAELGIRSPLKEAGLTKEDVRKLAKEYGISVANRPTAPCLATRFPYADGLTGEKLRKVEQGENYLKNLGLYNVRLRVHRDIARIEIDLCDMGTFLDRREEVVRNLKELGYRYVTLDLEGFRSGSMDEALLEAGGIENGGDGKYGERK